MTTYLEETTAAELRALRERGHVRLPAPERRKEIREQAGVSAAELARLLGTSEHSVWSWERGRRRPRLGVGRRYAEALHILSGGEQ